MIVKTAQAKINALGLLLNNGKLHPTQALIYCADTTQMELAMTETRVQGIESYSKITSSEGSQGSTDFGGISEREHILSKFAHGDLGLLFAIACLDEGVDIPTARTGIILASSGNPKEFIQRRGRLMRKSPSTGKEKAVNFREFMNSLAWL
jgi:superfamily II DNA or RNA helicase